MLKEGECLLGIQVWERPGGDRVVCAVRILDQDGREIAQGKTTGTDNDTNHLYEVALPQNAAITIEYTHSKQGAAQQQALQTSKEAQQRLDLFLSKR